MFVAPGLLLCVRYVKPAYRFVVSIDILNDFFYSFTTLCCCCLLLLLLLLLLLSLSFINCFCWIYLPSYLFLVYQLLYINIFNMTTLEPMDRTLFESKLIEELQKHPNLYTKRSQLDFHDYNTIEQSWNLVSSKLNSDTKTCKKIWRNLRDSYVRQLKKINCCIENGTDPTHYTKWKHFNKMSFLKNVITHRSLNDPKSLEQSSYIGYSASLADNFHVAAERNSITSKGGTELEMNSISSDPISEKEMTHNDPNNPITPNSCLEQYNLPKDEEDVSNSCNINNTDCGEVNSFLSNKSTNPLTFSSNLRCLASEESFGQHVARSLENLTSLRRSLAKVKIQEILSEFEQEDARDPIHIMPNIFLTSTFPKI